MNRISEQILAEMHRFSAVPRQAFLAAVRDVVRARNYTLEEEITTGDHSVIYRASRPGGIAIVKALAQSPLEDWKGDFEEELQKAKRLRSTGFIPLSDWELERVPKVLVSDYRELRPLAVVLREFRARRAASTRIDTVRYVLQVLADALAEYHEAGLIFGNITPSDVLIEGTPPDVHPRIPAYRFSQMVSSWERGVRGRGESRFSRERLTYLAPEQFESEVVDKGTDQYAFGLLAIALLQHRPPVEVKELQDLDAKRDFSRDPLQFDGPWKSRSPGLTKIIARALSYRPTDRWPTMRALSDALGPPATLQANNRQLAKQSYNRVKEQRDTFFRQFYDGLFASKKQLQRHFVGKGGQFDWAVQFLALDSAICRLLNFTSEEGLAEPTSLTDTARTHRDQLRLAPQDFDLFLDTFLKTLTQFDEGNEETMHAWRSTITPGISYMKKRGAVKITSASPSKLPASRGDKKR